MNETLQELGDVTAIDASSIDPIATRRRYARRTGYRFQVLKTTLLVDCLSGMIPDLRCAASRPYDTQIVWQNVIGISTGYNQ